MNIFHLGQQELVSCHLDTNTAFIDELVDILLSQ